MKIQKLNNTDYKIYCFAYNESSSIHEDTKDVIKQVQKRLRLKGFYKVVVFCNKLGLFIHLIKLEDSLYRNTLDLKIEIRDNDVYFKTKDYFIVKDLSTIHYKDGYYYCIVDDSFDEILEKVEFGDFVFGYDVSNVLDDSYVI